MRSTTLPSAVAVLLLCFTLAPTAVKSDPPHFLSDQFAIPSFHAAGPAKKPPVSILNDHLERLPNTYIVYGLRSSRGGKLVWTDRLGHATMNFPSPKLEIIINGEPAVTRRKAARPLPPSTRQSAPQ